MSEKAHSRHCAQEMLNRSSRRSTGSRKTNRKTVVDGDDQSEGTNGVEVGRENICASRALRLGAAASSTWELSNSKHPGPRC